MTDTKRSLTCLPVLSSVRKAQCLPVWTLNNRILMKTDFFFFTEFKKNRWTACLKIFKIQCDNFGQFCKQIMSKQTLTSPTYAMRQKDHEFFIIQYDLRLLLSATNVSKSKKMDNYSCIMLFSIEIKSSVHCIAYCQLLKHVPFSDE